LKLTVPVDILGTVKLDNIDLLSVGLAAIFGGISGANFEALPPPTVVVRPVSLAGISEMSLV
jgi:hypothetical protein